MKLSGKILCALGVFACVGAAVVMYRSLDKGMPAPVAIRADAKPVPSERTNITQRWRSLTDPGKSEYERLEAARSMDDTLSPEEVTFLFDLMDHSPPEADRATWWVVLNEIMYQMRTKGIGADQYSKRLSVLATNANASEVPRDYALQHLAQWLAPVMEGTPRETDPVRRSEALSAMAMAIKDPSALRQTIPGSGLLALAEISPRLTEEEMALVWGSLDNFMDSVIGGRTEAPMSLQSSAISVASLRGDVKFLPAIRGYVIAPDVNASIRLSSIAALGVYGRAEDEATLRALLQSGNSYQYAARAAIERITASRN